LLMFSRKAEAKPVPMDLNKQIVEVEKLLRRTIPKMVDVKIELLADLPRINADPSQVEQLIMNLALNARDAMPDKGKLTLRTNIATLDEDYCRLHVETNPGEYVLLEISDTGHGMDKETAAHIFEPFFTTKEMGRGTGLGLAMVHGIVKQHNGHISVYSEVGKGTTFGVYLPATEGEVETDAETTGIMPAFGTETVLLVDDEELVRELGARILTRHGYTVLQAEDGKKALDLFKKKRSRISLVILDLIMPEMGGAECLKELLKIDPNVRVLIASGYSADTSVKETIQTGAKGFVSKPFRVKELLQGVRNILDES
jgi:two-component system, cell cycle sensor histidine kinase and response regulator CckA